jgi:serpin B
MRQTGLRMFGPALFISLAAVVLLIAAPAVLADLCPKCKGMMYTMDIGKCANCAGDTTSGAFKLCKACSTKLGQCEHCRAPLGAKGAEGPITAPPAKKAAEPTPTSAKASADTPAPAADIPAWVAEANNAFAANLYAKLAGAEGNLFFSPNSIEVALAMTSAGARGKTFAEMIKVLAVSNVINERDGTLPIHWGLGAFLKDLNAEKGADGKPRGYQLSVANALWGQKGEPFLPEFLKVLKDNYGAGLSELDFATDTDGARKTINTWVEKATQDKIKDLLKAPLPSRDTKLVLTNAIYFKGTWVDQFKKELTKDAPFHLSRDKDVQAPLMNRTGDYEYMEEEMFQGLKLPYAGKELSMIIFLPRRVAYEFEGQTLSGIGQLEKEATAANLAAWMGKFRKQKVVVSIPKFKTTAEFQLADVLKSLGMVDAFGSKADFSGMNGKQDLFISAVVHKAFVDVNEEGTEAAAATAIVMNRMAVVRENQPPVFRADHPFLFLIRHEKTGAVLFMGRIADPTK